MCGIDVWQLMCGNDAEIDLVYMCGNSCVPHSIDVWHWCVALMCDIDVWQSMCGNDAEIDLVYMCNSTRAILYAQ